MKALLIVLGFIITNSSIFAQNDQAQSYYQLPDNNKMVSKALEIYDKLLANDTSNCMHYFDFQKSSLAEFNEYLPKFISGIAIDTSMTEYFSGQGFTTINFVILDEETKIEYLLKTASGGTNGST